jgi:hypothetical protein
MKTTPEEDARLVEEFNALPNENRYNGFTRNCADFARTLVNRYFPNSAKPDHLNDFGMTSPKAIAKSFSRYGEKRPELEFTAERFDQLPGPIQRSSPCRKGTEVSFRLKKWFIPLLVVRSHELPFFVAAYAITGRFNPDHELKRYPAEMPLSRMELEKYRDQFREILDTAVADGVFANAGEVKGYLKELGRDGKARLDADGRPLLDAGGRSVGITPSNLLGPDSDPAMAYKLMLSRIDGLLSKPATGFESEWKLLLESRDRFTKPDLSPPSDCEAAQSACH